MTGLWAGIDSLYPANVWLYVVAVVVTRFILAMIILITVLWVEDVGNKEQFFSMPKGVNHAPRQRENNDLSADIVWVFGKICGFIVLAEMAVRFHTATWFPYLPPVL